MIASSAAGATKLPRPFAQQQAQGLREQRLAAPVSPVSTVKPGANSKWPPRSTRSSGGKLQQHGLLQEAVAEVPVEAVLRQKGQACRIRDQLNLHPVLRRQLAHRFTVKHKMSGSREERWSP